MIRQNPGRWTRTALTLGVMAAGVTLSPVNADEPLREEGEHRMELTSTTFTDNGTLPLSTVDNFLVNNLNICTADGSLGGNQSPQLAWRHAPHNARSFVVVAYDTTAAFTHWGMYNIPSDTTELAAGAGVATSEVGPQINNDFGSHGYEGPCPPSGVEPFAHHYVFTVYALDTYLTLPSSANFPANAETLYHALLHAAREDHILASAGITGLFSSTPAE
jgi:Raf kinase inhibitor-like YbhB/YbcL family protein